MRSLSWIISTSACLNLAFLSWTLVSLSRCNANDGCLGFVWYFWLGCGAAMVISLAGGITWLFTRRMGVQTSLLPISVCVLFVSACGLLGAAVFSRT